MHLAQGPQCIDRNLTPVRLEPAALQSRVKHSTIEPLRSLDPDQARRFVGPDLDPNCLQRLSAVKTSRRRVNDEYYFQSKSLS